MPQKRNGERAALKQEWERLSGEHQKLLAETDRLKSSEDLAAIRAHHARIHEYQDQLHAWARALEMFHGSHGSVGLDDEVQS